MVGKEHKKRTTERKRDAEGKFAKSFNIVPAIVGIALIAFGGILVSTWFVMQNHFIKYYYERQDMIVISFPIVRKLREQEKILSPLADDEGVDFTDEEVLERADNTIILKGVYMLESTSGKNDGCKEDGLINGFGYRQNSSEFKCYKDFRSVVQKVDDWYTTRLEENGGNIAEALCYYNKGYANMGTCEYSQNFLKVLEL